MMHEDRDGCKEDEHLATSALVDKAREAREKRKAWGASPRTLSSLNNEPAKLATAV